MKLGRKLTAAWTVLRLMLSLANFVLKCVEPLLFLLVKGYDKYVYNPLQSWLSPLVQRVPREVKVTEEVKVTVFTANIVSWARTVLVIPIAICLKYQLNWMGCLLVLLHDFLDHLDGIVAKVQRRVYGKVDDPLLGGFMDAFCDKIVNVLALWSVLMVSDVSSMSWLHLALYLSPIVAIIAFEFTLGVVRVQDYFYSYYIRELKKSDEVGVSSGQATAAVMEGKLKEKLESMGIACLCVAQAAPVLMHSVSGILGVVCLVLSIRLAHASLSRKLEARKERKPLRDPPGGPTVGSCLHRLMTRRSVGVQVDLPPSPTNSCDFKFDGDEGGVKTPTPTKRRPREDNPYLSRSLSLVGLGESRVDRVYTVGCFDLFHDGHAKLLQRMRSLGRQVIVGVHDSRSIYLLKKRVPVDSTEKRMLNVKQYADMVFCIAGTEPSNFLACMFPAKASSPSSSSPSSPVGGGGGWHVQHQGSDFSSLYVRGDDMPDFPARQLCESVMPVTFLPYTMGVSSTKRRKEIINSNQSDPRLDLDANFFY